jgi:hypothetical protein
MGSNPVGSTKFMNKLKARIVEARLGGGLQCCWPNCKRPVRWYLRVKTKNGWIEKVHCGSCAADTFTVYHTVVSLETGREYTIWSRGEDWMKAMLSNRLATAKAW